MKNFITIIVLSVLGVGASFAKSLDFKEGWGYVPQKFNVENANEGFMYRSALLCGPKIDDENMAVQDTVYLYDVYAQKGKNTKVIGIVEGEEVPYVVFEIGKEVKIIADIKADEKIQEFLDNNGWDGNTNFNFAFFPQQKEFINNIIKKSTPIIEEKLGSTICVAYDFHSKNAMFKSSSYFLNDVFSKYATQEFIDKQARKAHYTKSTKYEDLKKAFDAKDPETVEFVSKYLTWAGKWDKKYKNQLQQRLSKD